MEPNVPENIRDMNSLKDLIFSKAIGKDGLHNWCEKCRLVRESERALQIGFLFALPLPHSI